MYFIIMRLLFAWTACVGSSVMGLGDTETSLGKPKKSLKILNTLKLMQISVDSPNINWKLLDLLGRRLKR